MWVSGSAWRPLALLIVALACKSNNIAVSEDNDYVTETVGSEGATLTLPDGTSVYIPADAFAEAHEVTLGRVASGYPPLPDGAIGAVYAVTPLDLEFQQPITLTVRRREGQIHLSTDGSWAALPTTVTSRGSLTAQATAPGYFTVVLKSGSTPTGDGGAGGAEPGGGEDSGIDGTLVVSGIPTQAAVVVGDTHAFWSASVVTDDFGQTQPAIQAVKLGSMDEPTTIVTAGPTYDPVSHEVLGPAAAVGEYVYWSEPEEDGTFTIVRCAPGEAPEVVASAAAEFGGSAEASVLFKDSAQQLRIYDGLTATLDPTTYTELIPAAQDPFTTKLWGTRSQDHVFAAYRDDSDYQIWSSLVGLPLEDSGLRFPAGSAIQNLGGVGSTLIVVVTAGKQSNVIAFDTENPDAAPNTIATFPGTANARSAAAGANPLIDAGFLYGFPTTGVDEPTLELFKIDLTSGERTKLGTAPKDRILATFLNATSVYLLAVNQTGSRDLYEWPR